MIRIPVLALAAACATLPLMAQQPDGRALFTRADKGHCIACHQVPAGAGPETRSDFGPPLSGTRMRELGKPTLRALLNDLTRANPGTPMPPYGRHRILEAAEIDRVVDYLHALPAQAPAAPALNAEAFDAERRAQVEANAGAAQAAGVVDAGRKIAQRKFKNGRTVAGCFPNGGRRVSAAYPQYDARLKRVVTLETAINQCLKTHNEALLDPAEAEMATLTAYLRSLSDNQKIAVRVPDAAKAKFEEGRSLYHTRMGQRNFACASCHVQGVGKRYEDFPLSAAAGQATHSPTYRDARPVTLQVRMRECLERMGAAPFAAGSDELNHLEYYLTFLSNGMPLKANAWRAR